MNYDTFKERLKVVMNGESNRSFSGKCDISEMTLRRYLQAETSPSLDTLSTIANVSGYSLAWLATGEGDMKRGETGVCLVEQVVPEEHVQNWNDQAGTLSEHDLKFILLRDVIETYESMRPERELGRKAREITMIYRHFIEHFNPSNDEVEISEYIDKWL